MTDSKLKQQARELLANATAKRGRDWEVQAGNIRRGDYDGTPAMEAIIAALSQKQAGVEEEAVSVAEPPTKRGKPQAKP